MSSRTDEDMYMDFMNTLIQTYMEAPTLEILKSNYRSFEEAFNLMHRIDFFITELSGTSRYFSVNVPKAMRSLMLKELKKSYHIADEHLKELIHKLPYNKKQRLIHLIDIKASELKLLQTITNESNIDLDTKFLMNEYELFLEYITYSI